MNMNDESKAEIMRSSIVTVLFALAAIIYRIDSRLTHWAIINVILLGILGIAWALLGVFAHAHLMGIAKVLTLTVLTVNVIIWAVKSVLLGVANAIYTRALTKSKFTDARWDTDE